MSGLRLLLFYLYAYVHLAACLYRRSSSCLRAGMPAAARLVTASALLPHTVFCTTAGERCGSVMPTHLAVQGLRVAGFPGGF